MATQYTKAREDNLINRGYKVVGENMTAQEIQALRDEGNYVTEMRYTTEVRGLNKFVVWARKKENRRLVEPKPVITELESELKQNDWINENGKGNKERSRVKCDKALEGKSGTIVKCSNGYVWFEKV